jgi:hypothetical protein
MMRFHICDAGKSFWSGDRYDLKQGYVVAAHIMKIETAQRAGWRPSNYGEQLDHRASFFDDIADAIIFS